MKNKKEKEELTVGKNTEAAFKLLLSNHIRRSAMTSIGLDGFVP